MARGSLSLSKVTKRKVAGGSLSIEKMGRTSSYLAPVVKEKYNTSSSPPTSPPPNHHHFQNSKPPWKANASGAAGAANGPSRPESSTNPFLPRHGIIGPTLGAVLSGASCFGIPDS